MPPFCPSSSPTILASLSGAVSTLAAYFRWWLLYSTDVACGACFRCYIQHSTLPLKLMHRYPMCPTCKGSSRILGLKVPCGEVQPVQDVAKSLSIAQVIWAPPNYGFYYYLVFVGWSSDPRKLGIKYCANRPCASYAVRAPVFESEANKSGLKGSPVEYSPVRNLTQSISGTFFPSFSPDGKFLAFLSARSSVHSGAHIETDSLYKIEWPANGQLCSSTKLIVVIPVIQSAENGCFPGLYCSNILMSSSPVDVPQIKNGCLVERATEKAVWSWLDVSSPILSCSEQVRSFQASHQFNILQIPVKMFQVARQKSSAT